MTINRRSLFGRLLGFIGGALVAKKAPSAAASTSFTVEVPFKDGIEFYPPEPGPIFVAELSVGCRDVEMGDLLSVDHEGRMTPEPPYTGTVFLAVEPSTADRKVLIRSTNWTGIEVLTLEGRS